MYSPGGTSVQSGQTSYITVNKARLAVQPWAYTTAEVRSIDLSGLHMDSSFYLYKVLWMRGLFL
jgi:hypothetical protein